MPQSSQHTHATSASPGDSFAPTIQSDIGNGPSTTFLAVDSASPNHYIYHILSMMFRIIALVIPNVANQGENFKYLAEDASILVYYIFQRSRAAKNEGGLEISSDVNGNLQALH
ncbi:hypothetical protein H0H92_003919 [Tricholoma furcatifolium]|nr:hypothetical protein H0H92_003919 [Tricholoma furcatifolium]